METASVVRYTDPQQANLFGNAKLVLHKFDGKPQDPQKRRETRSEVDSLSLKYRVRQIQTHNDPVLDMGDVGVLFGEVLKKIMPSADPECRKKSLVEGSEALCLLIEEAYDALEVFHKELENEGVVWREFPWMKETPRPIFTELV